MAVRNLLACALVALASIAAIAQERSVADQISTIDAQILLLKKRSELETVLASTASGSASGLPKVVSVGNSTQGMVARLLLPSGATENYREGDPIRTGMKVAAVSGKGVVVAIGDPTSKAGVKTVALDFVLPQSATPFGAPGQPTGPIPRELLPEAPPVGGMRPPAATAPPAAAPIQAPVPGTPGAAPAAPGGAPVAAAPPTAGAPAPAR